MHSVTVENAKKDLQNLINITLNGNDLINIVSDKGNVILLNENSYNDLLLTSEVNNNPEFKNSLIQNLKTDDFIDESKVEW